jgi:hypothetical protein
MIILLWASSAYGFWADEEQKTDVRPYAIIKAHNPKLSDTAVITDIWMDESGYIIFVDVNADGKEDYAHIHQIMFYTEDGSPIIVCRGDHDPKEIRKFIEKHIRLHSAAGERKVNEKIIS